MIPAKFLPVVAHVSAWPNVDRAEVYAFAAKIRDVLRYRYGEGKPTSAAFDFGNKPYESIWTILQKYDFQTHNLEYYEYSYDGYSYNSHIGEREDNILQALLNSSIIATFDIDCNDEQFKASVAEWQEGGYFDEEECEQWLAMVDDIDAARKAFSSCQKKEFDKAMANSTFAAVCEDFSDSLHIPVRMAFENMESLISLYNDDENYFSTYVSYKSDEVYHYSKYRDKLPEETRHMCDNAVRVFQNPFGVDDGFLEPSVYYDDETKACFVVVDIYSDNCNTGRDYNGLDAHSDLSLFFEEALQIITGIMPKLREEYGNA